MKPRHQSAFRIFIVLALAALVLLFFTTSIAGHSSQTACLIFAPIVFLGILLSSAFRPRVMEQEFLLPQAPLLPNLFQRPPPVVA